MKKKEAFERKWVRAGKSEDPEKWKELVEELQSDGEE